MGASWQWMTASGENTRDQVKEIFAREQDQDRYENGHSYSGGFGMALGLEFPSKTFDNFDAAEEWLQEHCRKWEAAQCVTYVDKDGTSRRWLIAAWCAS